MPMENIVPDAGLSTSATRPPEQAPRPEAQADGSAPAGYHWEGGGKYRRRRLVRDSGGGGSESSGGSSSGGTTTVQAGPLDSVTNWANAVLGGNFSNLPMYQELTDPQYADPTTNPYIQSMVSGLQGTLQQDWLGEMGALNEQAEAGGRYGSGTYLAARRNATQATDKALSDSIAQMYSGAYENERQRRAGLASQFLGAQQSAAQIPVNIYGINTQSADSRYAANAQKKVGMAGVRVQKGQLGLASQQFAFDKQMALANAQQDALNDYFNILSGIGGMGGTTQGTSPGSPASYIPPTNAAVTAAAGQIINHYA